MAPGVRSLTGPRLAPARGPATHLVVLCHGYGADGNDLIGLAPLWQRLLPTVAFTAPNAPEPCAGAPMGYQWFPISRLDPHEMQRGVQSAAAALDGFIDAELKRLDLPAERLALVGFSQGTMMSLQVGLRRAVKPAAIVGYSGMVTESDDLARVAPEAPPILLVHGDADTMIPPDFLFASATTLGRAGAAVQWHLSRGLGHSIDEQGLALGGLFLTMAFRGQLVRRQTEISCALG
jgi:phospholipase/carboxylesterase